MDYQSEYKLTAPQISEKIAGCGNFTPLHIIFSFFQAIHFKSFVYPPLPFSCNPCQLVFPTNLFIFFKSYLFYVYNFYLASGFKQCFNLFQFLPLRDVTHLWYQIRFKNLIISFIGIFLALVGNPIPFHFHNCSYLQIFLIHLCTFWFWRFFLQYGNPFFSPRRNELFFS